MTRGSLRNLLHNALCPRAVYNVCLREPSRRGDGRGSHCRGAAGSSSGHVARVVPHGVAVAVAASEARLERGGTRRAARSYRPLSAPWLAGSGRPGARSAKSRGNASSVGSILIGVTPATVHRKSQVGRQAGRRAVAVGGGARQQASSAAGQQGPRTAHGRARRPAGRSDTLPRVAPPAAAHTCRAPPAHAAEHSECVAECSPNTRQAPATPRTRARRLLTPTVPRSEATPVAMQRCASPQLSLRCPLSSQCSAPRRPALQVLDISVMFRFAQGSAPLRCASLHTVLC